MYANILWKVTIKINLFLLGTGFSGKGILIKKMEEKRLHIGVVFMCIVGHSFDVERETLNLKLLKRIV